MKKLHLEPNILVTLIRITAHYKNEHEKKLRVYYKDQSEIHFTDLHLVHSLAHNKVGGYHSFKGRFLAENKHVFHRFPRLLTT